jgi:hypothetical protein
MVENLLLQRKTELGLTSEIKWQKVDASVVERYEQFLETFFDQMAAGLVFMRVMFTKNSHVPVGLTKEQHEESYYRLYYQFLKHGFGLDQMPEHAKPPRLPFRRTIKSTRVGTNPDPESKRPVWTYSDSDDRRQHSVRQGVLKVISTFFAKSQGPFGRKSKGRFHDVGSDRLNGDCRGKAFVEPCIPPPALSGPLRNPIRFRRPQFLRNAEAV